MIQVKNLTVEYQHNKVLDDISLTINKGEYIGIVGPNGSGKTTFIKALLGLVESGPGQIQLFDKSIKQFDQWYRIGYLPQFTPMSRQGFPATVSEIIATGLLSKAKFPKIITAADQASVNDVLVMFNIQKLKNNKIAELSGGERQRVLLARAMITNPECLILDEPTAALDPESRMQFYQILQKINAEQNITIILITHDSSTIGQFAHKLLYLDRKVIFYGAFGDFCHSEEMTSYFGHFAQHLICHQHHGEE